MSEERAIYNQSEIRKECENPFPIWEQPTPEEVRALIAQTGLSNAQIARFVGVSDGKQVRRWKAGQSKMPFAVWGVLMASVGRDGCINRNALEFAKMPNAMALVDDINNLELGEGTRVSSTTGAVFTISHTWKNKSGLDVSETFQIDVSGMGHNKALDAVIEKIQSFSN